MSRAPPPPPPASQRRPAPVPPQPDADPDSRRASQRLRQPSAGPQGPRLSLGYRTPPGPSRGLRGACGRRTWRCYRRGAWGVVVLWARGCRALSVPRSCTASTPAASVFFGTKSFVTASLKNQLGPEYRQLITVLSVAGALVPCWLIKTPSEVLKTRRQAGVVESSFEEAKRLVNDEGVLSWRSLGSE